MILEDTGMILGELEMGYHLQPIFENSRITQVRGLVSKSLVNVFLPGNVVHCFGHTYPRCSMYRILTYTFTMNFSQMQVNIAYMEHLGMVYALAFCEQTRGMTTKFLARHFSFQVPALVRGGKHVLVVEHRHEPSLLIVQPSSASHLLVRDQTSTFQKNCSCH